MQYRVTQTGWKRFAGMETVRDGNGSGMETVRDTFILSLPITPLTRPRSRRHQHLLSRANKNALGKGPRGGNGTVGNGTVTRTILRRRADAVSGDANGMEAIRDTFFFPTPLFFPLRLPCTHVAVVLTGEDGEVHLAQVSDVTLTFFLHPWRTTVRQCGRVLASRRRVPALSS